MHSKQKQQKEAESHTVANKPEPAEEPATKPTTETILKGTTEAHSDTHIDFVLFPSVPKLVE